MSDILHVLLKYAETTVLPGMLSANGHAAASRQSARRWDAFQKMLSPEQSAHLEALPEQDTPAQLPEIEAAFQAGLSLGLKLSRL